MTFESTLYKMPGKGGWHLAPIPEEYAPPVTGSWGRTPVMATVDGQTWATSVWRSKEKQSLLPVPKKIRKGKGVGDVVEISIEPR